MNISRIEFNSAGFKELLNSDGVYDLVQSTTDAIAKKANENYGGDAFQPTVIKGFYGGGRWIGFVTSTDRESAAAESEDQALTRAL